MAIGNKPPQTRLDDETIEIRLSDIVAFLKSSRRYILLGALIGGVLGAIYAFSKPNEYTSQVTLLPEIQSKSSSNLGGLSSLAGLAGIDVNSFAGGGDAVRPELYPTILQSAPFTLYISEQLIFSKEYKRAETLETYLSVKNKPSLLTKLISLLTSEPDSVVVSNQASSAGILELTKQQEEMALYIYSRIVGAFDKKTGVMTISSTMPDPFVAASSTQQALKYLTDYITSYRTEKARQEVDFLSRQVSTAKQRYQTAEVELSSYRDRNRSVFLNTAKIEEQRIQAEFLLAQDLYNTLSKQSELAKIKVQQSTPVFKILEPAQIPLKKSAPKRVIITLIAAFLGCIVGVITNAIRTYKQRKADLI